MPTKDRQSVASKTRQSITGKAKTKGDKDKSTTKKRSTSSRVDLVFPVGRTHRMFKQAKVANNVGLGAAIFTAAVMEYIMSEIIELAGNAA